MSTTHSNSSPVGIFDSGIGGLTVAKAVSNLLPMESIVYFGDTAHLPYGDKSEVSIQSYSIKICNHLLNLGCKVILIACNTASATSYELVKEYVGSKALVLNVVDPTVQYVCDNYQNKVVGLIGTKRTVLSGVYEQKIACKAKSILLKSLATPLLVPIIEEGFYADKIGNDVLNKYLSNEHLNGVSALILGCTHYPLIKDKVDAYYKGRVMVIDSSTMVANELKKLLSQQGLLNKYKKPKNSFFVSDYTKSFEETARIFFGKDVSLSEYKIWD